MKPVFVSKDIKPITTETSIFLAGPSPRGNLDFNWRPEALDILSKLNFDGSVFVPLQSDWLWLNSWQAQIEWELHHLHAATIIVFWIPRDLKYLPGFTTNVEYGMFINSGKIVLGFPTGAAKIGYLNYLAKKNSVPVFNDLESTLAKAVELSR